MDIKTFHLFIGFMVLVQRAAGDDLGLLSSTLRAFRTVCCDDEQLSLSCPIGTSISVELVQYGAKAAEGNDTIQCAYSEPDTHYHAPEPTGPALSTVDFSLAILPNATTRVTPAASTEPTTNDTLAPVERSKDDQCTPLYVLQYSILQTVVEACQKKRRCRIQATPKNFPAAPCAGIHRLVEVNHKCRPFEFRSLISCEKDIVRLTCGQYTRIAIYSATYGRTAYESTHCTQTAASQEQTCLSEHTSHTLTEICQGRRKCTVAVESSTFGNPCPENTRVYLKVIYACVSRNVFRERYITPLEEDELDERPYESNELYDEELTPAPNQIEGSAVGKSTVVTNKYAGESAVKAENVVTFNKDAGEGPSGGDYSSLLSDDHLLIVGVAVLIFCCLCLSAGALVAYKMKLFPVGSNRCIKASESSDSHSTPSSYRATSEDFDLVECIPDTATMAEKAAEQQSSPPPPPQTYVQSVGATGSTLPTSAILPAFKFAEPRGSLSQISTTMFILPNYLMAGPVAGTLSNRRPKDTIPSMPPGDNLTITLATSDGIPSGSGSGPGPGTICKVESTMPAYYAPHLQSQQQQQHHQHHNAPFGTSCNQCTVLGWQAVGGPSAMYGGKLLALENPAISGATTGPTSLSYHRNQSLKPFAGEAETGPSGEEERTRGIAPGKAGPGPTLAQAHPFLWLGLKIALM
ncbi:uncharacterized protein LOC128732145 [Anopheles nili]|uniref:uncharacterized protein LOC128732145 n=1 Tax=Anopheles nili TaxID=185578 RepID=UPI00237AD3A1|nr:uncharacterized protein LOC128732145 [Anopheles nili]